MNVSRDDRNETAHAPLVRGRYTVVIAHELCAQGAISMNERRSNPDEPFDVADVVADVHEAARALQTAVRRLEEAHAMLGAFGEHEPTAHLAALWDELDNLSLPVVHAGTFVIASMLTIGNHLGYTPPAPAHMQWLSGIDVRALHATNQRQQQADALLAWLDPYLDRVSSRPRTAIMHAIARFVTGHGPQSGIERLTPETFLRDIQNDNHRAIIANIRGLGPHGLRELRAAAGQQAQ